MSDLVVIGFDDEFKAQEVRLTLLKLQKEYLIDMEDAVVVTKNDKGKVKLHQSYDLTTSGAVQGSFWGLLVGTLFLNPLLGMAVGAGAGTLTGAATDIGIDDNFMRQLGETLKPGTSALFVLVKKSTPDKVLEELKQFEGKVLRTSLPKDAEEKLQEALSKS